MRDIIRNVLETFLFEKERVYQWQQPVIILDKTGADNILAHLAICSCMDHIHPHLGKYYVDIFALK